MRFVENGNSDELECRERFSVLRVIGATFCLWITFTLVRGLMKFQIHDNFETFLFIVLLVLTTVISFFGIACGFHYGRFIINRATGAIKCWEVGRFPNRLKAY